MMLTVSYYILNKDKRLEKGGTDYGREDPRETNGVEAAVFTFQITQ